MATLAELERDYDIDDVMDAHHWLDEKEEAEAVARARSEQRGG